MDRRTRLNGSAKPMRIAARRCALSITALIGAFLVSGCDGLRLDQNLCPVNEDPPGNTILLLDPSDPLTPKHREELKRLVRDMQIPPEEDQEPSDFYVARGEALIVYELAQDLAEMDPVLRVCNPGGHPDTWRWWEGLFRGKAIALRQWQRFGAIIEELFDAPQNPAPQSRSPIIEALGVIVPRHAESVRGSGRRTHLIIYSDLLQHSDALSQYGPYPPPEAIRRHLRTNLSGIEVSLFRLERAAYEQWQTVDHYYWWTSLIATFGGTAIWQESI